MGFHISSSLGPLITAGAGAAGPYAEAIGAGVGQVLNNKGLS